MNKHNFILDIDRIIKNKLKELKLTPKIPLKKFIQKNKRFYSVPCLDSKNSLLFFKILIINDKGAREDLKREIKITKFLSEHNNLKEKINTPLFIVGEDKNFPYWTLRQYLKGPLMGNFYEINIKKKKKYIKSLNDNLRALQGIPCKLVKKVSQECNLWTRDYKGYLRMIASYKKAVGEKKGKINFKKIYNFFEARRKIFKNSNFVIAHGDFTMANFFIHQEKVYLTDWEHCHLDNFAYDISHLWIQLWQYPVWRKKLISDFISLCPKNKIVEFEELFRAVMLTEALGELRWTSGLCEKKHGPGAIKNARKTIENSLKSFNKLTNL